ncbi:MAG: hypothetical protein PF517_02600 [Salinivirgaceae bacterium]|nr:hypothetical protein [Salinivirgaceae bacterium]
MIGDKLFKHTLLFVKEDIKALSFIDILSKLKKLEIIEDSDTWLKLREIRNEVSHEYPIMLEEAIESLNLILSMKNELLSFFVNCVKYLKAKDSDNVLNI